MRPQTISSSKANVKKPTRVNKKIQIFRNVRGLYGIKPTNAIFTFNLTSKYLFLGIFVDFIWDKQRQQASDSKHTEINQKNNAGKSELMKGSLYFLHNISSVLC